MPDEVEFDLSWKRNGQRGAQGVLKAEAGGQPVLLDKIDILRDQDRERAIRSLVAQFAGIPEDTIRARLLELAIQVQLEAERPSAMVRDFGDQYRVVDGYLCHSIRDRTGSILDEPVANFDPRIVEEIVRHDGVEEARRFVIDGQLWSGQALEPVEVSAEELYKSEWPLVRWGTRANVHAGPRNRDHLRAALQSRAGEVSRRVVRTHTGWVKDGDNWHYLHAGGAIGPAGAEPDIGVDLPADLARYRLPDPPVGAELIRCIRASLDLAQRLGPDRVMLPLLATVYRSVLPGGDFSTHVAGQSGSFKTELAALMLQHLGADLTAKNMPANWSSSGNALEGLAFMAKDTLLGIDDFCPAGNSAAENALHHKVAERLFRAQGNRSGRQRMRQDGSLRPVKPPRGMILATGEDSPKGQSIRARLLIVEVQPHDIAQGRLTTCQRVAARGDYAGAMAGYVGWLAARYETVVADLRADTVQLRNHLSELMGSGQHRRTPALMADLLAGFRLWLRFARDARAITQADEAALDDRCLQSLLGLAGDQATQQEAVDPCHRYVSLIRSIVSSGQAHLASPDGRHPEDPERFGWRERPVAGRVVPDWDPQGSRIGWVDGPNLYLDPEAAFAECQKRAAQQGDHLPIQRDTLHRRLKERRFLVSTDETRKKIPIRKSLGGSRHYVLHMSAIQILQLDTEEAMDLTDQDLPSLGGPPSAEPGREVEEL